jgi:hypothetical protein
MAAGNEHTQTLIETQFRRKNGLKRFFHKLTLSFSQKQANKSFSR